MNHPAVFISLNLLGSMVLDIDRNVLNAHFLSADGDLWDSFAIAKGIDLHAPEIFSIGYDNSRTDIFWYSVPGRYYQVQFTEHIDPPQWQNVEQSVMATGTYVGWHTRVAGDPQTGFFRVLLLD